MFKRTKNYVKKKAKKTGSSLSRGLGLPILTDAAEFVKGGLRGFFNIPKEEEKLSFTEAMQRQGIQEHQLGALQQRYMQQFGLFLFCAVLILVYAFYLFTSGAIFPATVVVLMSAVLVIYAIRAHFWAFQIKQRKLGCTLQEWWQGKVHDKDNFPTR